MFRGRHRRRAPRPSRSRPPGSLPAPRRPAPVELGCSANPEPVEHLPDRDDAVLAAERRQGAEQQPAGRLGPFELLERLLGLLGLLGSRLNDQRLGSRLLLGRGFAALPGGSRRLLRGDGCDGGERRLRLAEVSKGDRDGDRGHEGVRRLLGAGGRRWPAPGGAGRPSCLCPAKALAAVLPFGRARGRASATRMQIARILRSNFGWGAQMPCRQFRGLRLQEPTAAATTTSRAPGTASRA